jgi:hypothetical protein
LQPSRSKTNGSMKSGIGGKSRDETSIDATSKGVYDSSSKQRVPSW